MTLEEMLQQYLAAELAKNTPKPEEAQKAVTEERLGEILSAFGEQISKAFETKLAEVQTAVAEQVEKALPVREPGAGRAGTETPAEGSIDADPVAYLAKKARTEEGLSQEEKELAWAMTYAVISEGMKL